MGFVCDDNVEDEDDEDYGDCVGVEEGWSIYHNGLVWAWASPCSGGCSFPEPEHSYGYRLATAEECADKPSNADFDNGAICASHIFDPKYDHCDSGNELVCDHDNGYNEMLLVCDPNPTP